MSERHACHWSGCKNLVPVKMWGCHRHWEMLTENLRLLIWEAWELDDYQSVKDMADKWVCEESSGQGNKNRAQFKKFVKQLREEQTK